MISIIIFLYYSIRSKFNASFLLGALFIIINNFLTFNSIGSYFSGSDASGFYLSALNIIKNQSEIFSVFDYRYLFYNLYQNITCYPFIESEGIASLMIKISNWVIFHFSYTFFFNFLSQKNRVNTFFKASLFIIGLWLSFYNFRDIIILSLIIFSAVFFLKNSRKKLIFTLSILFFFRGFLVLIFLASYFISKLITLKKDKLSSFFTIFLTFLFISLSFYYPLFQENTKLLMSLILDVNFKIEAEDPNNIIFALFAGNPINFLIDYINGYERSFFISNISAFLLISIYSLSYFLLTNFFINLFMGVHFKSDFIDNTSIKKNRTLFLTCFITFFLLTITYNYELGGLQERIKSLLLFLIIIMMSLIKFKTKYFQLSYFISALLIILILITKL